MENYRNKEILITGGTGFLGRHIVKELLTNPNYQLRGLRILSRDEEKHRKLELELKGVNTLYPYSQIIGDIRDKSRMKQAARGVNYIIHTAAMKQVPACNNDPIEAVHTNINGTANLIEAALTEYCDKMIFVSTDKAVAPVNLYGATKAVAEKLVINANKYNPYTQFSVCRYGNVTGSTGSVIPIFINQLKTTKEVTITHRDMTRFWITIDEAVRFVLDCLNDMENENPSIYVPILKAYKITNLVNALAELLEIKKFNTEMIGIRTGEKIHEHLISPEEFRNVIKDNDNNWYQIISEVIETDPKQEYHSGQKFRWMDKTELKKVLEGEI